MFKSLIQTVFCAGCLLSATAQARGDTPAPIATPVAAAAHTQPDSRSGKPAVPTKPQSNPPEPLSLMLPNNPPDGGTKPVPQFINHVLQ